MPFISGSQSSKIIDELISKGCLGKVNMYIATALNQSNLIDNYTKVVKKVISKPINKNDIQEIVQNLNS